MTASETSTRTKREGQQDWERDHSPLAFMHKNATGSRKSLTDFGVIFVLLESDSHIVTQRDDTVSPERCGGYPHEVRHHQALES